MNFLNASYFFQITLIVLSVMVVSSCSEEVVETKQKQKSVTTQQAQQKAVATQQAEQKTEDYTAQVIPEKMTVLEKKKRFAYLVAPAVEEVHAELMKQFNKVSESVLNGTDAKVIEKLKTEYKAETAQDLLKALKPHPQSIGLAQAAMESAWGTSRFFREANNIFGVWSFDENEPRIAASQKRAGKTIWVKKYPTINAAVKDYYRVLARGNAFAEFRTLKMETRDPYRLVKKLDRYSEKGDAYGEELASMIRYNKFDAYDL